MAKEFSIAVAKDNLSEVVREAERTGAVRLTRRGKPVAVVLSEKEYHRLRNGSSRVNWTAVSIDTKRWRFDREQANER